MFALFLQRARRQEGNCTFENVNSVQRKNNENSQSENENKPDNKRVFLLAGFLDKLKTDQVMFQLESQT